MPKIESSFTSMPKPAASAKWHIFTHLILRLRYSSKVYQKMVHVNRFMLYISHNGMVYNHFMSNIPHSMNISS